MMMSQEQFDRILDDHKKWMHGEGGKRASFFREDFSHVIFKNRAIADAKFVCCEFRGSNFTNNGFVRCDFHGCSFFGTVFDECTFRLCDFSN